MNWQEIKREEVFRAYSRIIEKVAFKLPNNTIEDFYILIEKPTVCVLAITKDQKVVLVKQYRPGPKRVLMELPGGYIDENEKPLDAIQRECKEETGYAGKFSFIAQSFHSAYSTRVKYFFIATECEKTADRELEDSEASSEVVLMDLKDFVKHVQSGNLTDADGAYAGLQYLKIPTIN
jgi:ADP-ribose pyrophosphatase